MMFSDKTTASEQQVLVTRCLVPLLVVSNGINSTRRSLIAANEWAITTDFRVLTVDGKTRVNCESIAFVCLDIHYYLSPNLILLLRTINDYVENFADSSTCFDWLRSSNDRIFFISSSNDKQLIKIVNNFTSVEAIFILDSNEQIVNENLSKLVGVYALEAELFMGLRNTLEWFEQTQLKVFAFEDDKNFLWSQLWQENLLEMPNAEMMSDKQKLVDMARRYYRDNEKVLGLVNEFQRSYSESDAVRWCFLSPFPSRLLHHALRAYNSEQLNLYNFLLTDVSSVLKQQSTHKASPQLYRGTKLTSELLQKLEKYIGKQICPSGFFICTKSRRYALALAWSPAYRPDLLSVLFQINNHSSMPLIQLPAKGISGLVAFDAYATFKVVSVTRGSISIVNMEPANEGGRRPVRQDKTDDGMRNLSTPLDQRVLSPDISARFLSHRTPSLSSTNSKRTQIGEDEMEAQQLLADGDIDQALAAYKRVQSDADRILNIMGDVYAQKKGDYDSAIVYHTQALKIQDEAGKDMSNTLTHLGTTHQNRHEYDLALDYHTRALNSRRNADRSDQAAIANNLIGIANAHWAQHNFSVALDNAQQALVLHDSVVPRNDVNSATALAILANIHHDSGDDVRALELCTQALALLESSQAENSFQIASVLNNLGAIQLSLEAISDAQHSFNRALHICAKILPQGHPKLVTMENNVRRINQMQQNEKDTLSSQW